MLPAVDSLDQPFDLMGDAEEQPHNPSRSPSTDSDGPCHRRAFYLYPVRLLAWPHDPHHLPSPHVHYPEGDQILTELLSPNSLEYTSAY